MSHMAPRSDIPTAKVTPAPVVLCVGCSGPLARRCRDSAVEGGATMVETDVINAATLAGQTHPLVIVVPAMIYDYDADSFEALATDVRARLVKLPDDKIAQDDLDTLIIDAMMEAEEIRGALEENAVVGSVS